MSTKQKINNYQKSLDLFMYDYDIKNESLKDTFVFYLPVNKCVITEERCNYYLKEIDRIGVDTL